MYGWELDYKESWVPRNWCFWTAVLEKTLESPLDCKEIQPVHPKGNQSWIFIGRTDAEAETPILWPPDVKNWLIWKNPGAGKDWRRENGMTENEMVGWHHWLNGREFDEALGVGETGKPGMLQSMDATEQLNWLILKLKLQYFGHLMQRANSLEKTLMPGKIEDKKRGERQRMRWLLS